MDLSRSGGMGCSLHPGLREAFGIVWAASGLCGPRWNEKGLWLYMVS